MIKITIPYLFILSNPSILTYFYLISSLLVLCLLLFIMYDHLLLTYSI